MKLSLTINGKTKSVDVDPDTPLLWVIRDHLNLTGTKFGCGLSQCGSCTVHLGGNPIRSCVTPASALQGQSITTIEGLSGSAMAPEARAITEAWGDVAVVQCGYCQSGQIMSATALLKQTPKPTDADIDNYMSGNICRCNTYVRIRKAIHQAADNLALARIDPQMFYDATRAAANDNPKAGGDRHGA